MDMCVCVCVCKLTQHCKSTMLQFKKTWRKKKRNSKQNSLIPTSWLLMAISQDQAGCPQYLDLKGNTQDGDWARERGNTTFPGDMWQGLYELKTQTSHFLGSLPSLAASLACLEAPQGHVDPLGYPDPKEEMEVTLVLVQPNLWDIP